MKTTLLFATAILFPVAALAQQAQSEAQTCASCHGDNGQGNAASGYPRIAGQPAAYLEQQLDAYANGSRTNSVMTPIAKSLSEAQRKSLAQHYSQSVLNPPDTLHASTPSPLGRDIATVGLAANRVQGCEGCHGPGGIGANNATPLLAGRPTKYLVSALHEWKSGSRKTDPSLQMNHIASGLSDQDIQAVADYFGDQPPPATALCDVKQHGALASTPTQQQAAGNGPAQGVSGGRAANTQGGSGSQSTGGDSASAGGSSGSNTSEAK